MINKPALIVCDFDGVMTDNRVLLDADGKESVFVNRSDGLAVGLLRKEGIPCMILTTEKVPIAVKRAEKLHIDIEYGIDDKAQALQKICADRGIALEDIWYVGNDLNDLEAMRLAGYAVAPADAYPEIKEIADIVLETKGGYGVIREIYARLGRS